MWLSYQPLFIAFILFPCTADGWSLLPRATWIPHTHWSSATKVCHLLSMCMHDFDFTFCSRMQSLPAQVCLPAYSTLTTHPSHSRWFCFYLVFIPYLFCRVLSASPIVRNPVVKIPCLPLLCCFWEGEAFLEGAL